MKKLISVLAVILVFVLLVYFAYRPSAGGIVIYGDSRTVHHVHRKIMDAIMQLEPRVVFHTGDLVTDNAEWPMVNEIISELGEFYPAIGNHEYTAGEEAFFDNFELPNNEQWYSVERMGIHFIVLDSCVSMDKGSEQYAWLQSDLRNISDKIKFTIAIFHHPVFGSRTGSHAEDEKGLRDTIVPLFERYGVDAVFNGHTHAYERLFCNNIYYIITGGGGATLHQQKEKGFFSQKYVKAHHFCILNVQDNRLSVKALDSGLNLIDQFVIQ